MSYPCAYEGSISIKTVEIGPGVNITTAGSSTDVRLELVTAAASASAATLTEIAAGYSLVRGAFVVDVSGSIWDCSVSGGSVVNAVVGIDGLGYAGFFAGLALDDQSGTYTIEIYAWDERDPVHVSCPHDSWDEPWHLWPSDPEIESFSAPLTDIHALKGSIQLQDFDGTIWQYQ